MKCSIWKYFIFNSNKKLKEYLQTCIVLAAGMDKSMQYSLETDWLVYHKYLQWGAYCREGSGILQRQRQGGAAYCRRRSAMLQTEERHQATVKRFLEHRTYWWGTKKELLFQIKEHFQHISLFPSFLLLSYYPIDIIVILSQELARL